VASKVLFFSPSAAAKNMLKVTIIETRHVRRLVLEGTLVQPWVTELGRVWSAASDGLPKRRLIVDLNDVTTIGKDGEHALFEMMRQGARFSCGGVLTRYLLEQLAVKCQVKLRDVMDQSPRTIETLHKY
jgi:hypothetical protein